MLTDDNKKRLNDQLDAGLPATLSFGDRKSAFIHVLRSAEVRRSQVEQVRQRYGDAIAEQILDITREALHHCISWICGLVPTDSDGAPCSIPKTNDPDITYCLSLLQTAADYSEASDVMTMLWLDRVEINHEADDEIELAYTAQQIDFEAAQWLWRLTAKEIPAPREAINDLQTWIYEQDKSTFDESVIFKIPEGILSHVNDGMKPTSDRLWQLPGVMDFEAFTTDDFRRFWNALMTLAVIPRLFFNATSDPNVSIPIGSKNSWISLLSNLSGIEQSKTLAMFDLLTYSFESTTKQRNRRAADSISQPIFKIGDDLFAVSSMYVLVSNAERNLFDLAAAKMADLYDRRKDEKEKQWAESLCKSFEQRGFIAVPQKKYDNGAGDIDVLVYDRARKVGLIIQLKWLLFDRVKSGHLKDANKCIKQAKDAASWIVGNPDLAQQLLGIDREEITEGKFFLLAALKDGLLNGFIYDAQVPLLSGNILDAYVAKYGDDLEKLWTFAREGRFLAVKNYHYQLGDMSYIPQKPFNGIRFKRRRIMPKEAWEPWIDLG